MADEYPLKDFVVVEGCVGRRPIFGSDMFPACIRTGLNARDRKWHPVNLVLQTIQLNSKHPCRSRILCSYPAQIEIESDVSNRVDVERNSCDCDFLSSQRVVKRPPWQERSISLATPCM